MRLLFILLFLVGCVPHGGDYDYERYDPATGKVIKVAVRIEK